MKIILALALTALHFSATASINPRVKTNDTCYEDTDGNLVCVADDPQPDCSSNPNQCQ